MAVFKYAALISLTGLSGCLTQPSYGIAPIGFATNGDFVIATTKTGGQSAIVTFSPDESTWNTLYRTPRQISGWDFAPDGNSVALALRVGRDSGVLGILDLSDGAFDELVHEDEVITQPHYSRDGLHMLFVSNTSSRTSAIRQVDLNGGRVSTLTSDAEMYVTPFFFDSTSNVACVRLSEWEHYSPIASSTWQFMEVVRLGSSSPEVLDRLRTRVDEPPSVFVDDESVALCVDEYMEHEVFVFEGMEFVGRQTIYREPFETPDLWVIPDDDAAIVATWMGGGNQELPLGIQPFGRGSFEKLLSLRNFIGAAGVHDIRLAVSRDGRQVAVIVVTRPTSGGFESVLIVFDRETGSANRFYVPRDMLAA